ncbi:MAG TPA: hypothetical protein VH591_08250 [Ktedonobacterales bacterium]|jgi:hypothetical protein
MSQTITLTDDQYATLVAAAAYRDQTPEGVLAQWIEVERICNLLRSPRFEELRRERMRRIKDDPNATQPSMDHPSRWD